MASATNRGNKDDLYQISTSILVWQGWNKQGPAKCKAHPIPPNQASCAIMAARTSVPEPGPIKVLNQVKQQNNKRSENKAKARAGYVTSTDSTHIDEYHNELSMRAPSNG
jgi:hypothetical protein